MTISGSLSNQVDVSLNQSKTMDQTSQMKVMKAGFRILRIDDQPSPRIKVKESGNYEWRTLDKFETKAARDRRFKELIQDKRTIQN
ncbi:MAG: hypothetical protein AB9834_00090 [Lentimicrobium sp.]